MTSLQRKRQAEVYFQLAGVFAALGGAVVVVALVVIQAAGATEPSLTVAYAKMVGIVALISVAIAIGFGLYSLYLEQ